MLETSANNFRQNLKGNIDKCISHHELLRVTRKNGENFMVIGESDWQAIAETIHLSQIPGFAESVHKAAKEPLEKGTRLEDLKW